MGFSPVENMKAFVVQRPPLVVFLICIAGMAIGLLSLAYYTDKTPDIPNPDVMNWNQLLAKMSGLDYCAEASSPSPPPPATTAAVPNASHPLENTHLTTNHSVFMQVKITPSSDLIRATTSHTFIHASLTGKDLGLPEGLHEEQINVTLALPVRLTARTTELVTCVYLEAAQHVFPPSPGVQECQAQNGTGPEYHTAMATEQRRTDNCAGRTLIQLEHQSQSKMTILLSIGDRSLMNLHLLHTSYFLFVMAVTVVVYGLVRGGRRYPGPSQDSRA